MALPNKNVLTKGAPKGPDTSGPTILLKGIIRLSDELSSVMETEITLIETRDMKAHAELLKRKQRLTIDYRSSLKSIALQPQCLKNVPVDLRQLAMASGQKLSTATQRNAKVLRAAIQAVERLAKTIIGIVKEEVVPQGAYANHNLGKPRLGYSPTCRPVTGVRTA